MEKQKKHFDFIVVGAGSAGCVIASRLAEDSGRRILLAEAGPRDDTWKIQMPAALIYNLCDDKYNWFYHTVAQPNMNGRRIYCPRGRVWGGSSSLNAMAWVRGHAADFNRWQSEGAAGWDYHHCLPYFKKSENFSEGGDDYRGDSGPLKVTAGMRGKKINPLFSAFVEAGIEVGYPRTMDPNGYQQEGFGRMDMSISGGMRQNAAAAYLRPALKNPNLIARTKLQAARIIIEKNRAVGVEFIAEKNSEKIYADEIILCAGAINSPQLLMLSGVGCADELRRHQIDINCNLPGVGANLQDHLDLYIQRECKKPVTLYRATQFHAMALAGLRWFLTKEGDCASAHLEAGAFIRSREGIAHPDVQYHFLPSVVNDHGRELYPGHAYQAHVSTMRPASRGRLQLQNSDPLSHPLIDPNYLAEENDRIDLRKAVHLTREIFAAKSFDEFRGREISPGEDIKSDSAIDEWIRAKGDTAYHPCCTCKMGGDGDPMAVVNSEGKVRGIDGLRIADASVMPSMSSGNLNAPTIMLAEKLADAIRGRPSLPPMDAPVYQSDNSRQR